MWHFRGGGGQRNVTKFHQGGRGGGGEGLSKKCGKSVTYYLNGLIDIKKISDDKENEKHKNRKEGEEKIESDKIV
jgi:hypothetical protein